MSPHTKTTRLTDAQKAELPIYREQMRALGLRTQWADDDAIRKTVLDLYQAAGLKRPAVLVLSSPLMCLATRHLLKNTNQLWGQLKDQLWDQLGDHLGGQLRGQLRGQLEDQLWGQLRGQLWGQLWGQLRGQEIEWQSLWFAGGSELYWAAFYSYAQQIGVNFSESQETWLKSWIKYAETSGCLFPYEGIAFVSHRPTQLSFDENRMLHSEVGPAMAFSDGFALHCWHGTRVPAEWVLQKETIDPSEILKCDNVEQRAAGLNLIGFARALERLDWRLVDSEPNPQHGELIAIKLDGLPDEEFALKTECPRNGTILEAVVPSELEAMTVKATQAWKAGVPLSLYNYPEQRS